MSTETELKLAVTGVTADQISQLAVVREWLNEELPARHLGNVYFDTPEMVLQQRRIGLRLRRDGDQWLQTVKTSGSGSSGLHRRGEWEMPVAGEALELERFDAPPLRKLFKSKKLRNGLAPVFRTDFQRTTWDLAFPDGARIEMVLDLGEVVADGRSEAISEVELELKAGDSASRLFALAQSLSEVLPMRVLNASKAERGYRLGGHGEPYAASKSGPVGLRKRDTAEQALLQIMHHGLAHLQANEPVLLNRPEDREAVHQMRVATRRMRAGLALYRPLIPKAVSAEVNDGIKQITDALGPARDWDVFIAETLAPLAADFPQHAGLETLIAAAEVQREVAYRQATEALLSGVYTQGLLHIGGWLEGHGWRDWVSEKQRRALDGPAVIVAVKVLAAHHRRVHKLGDEFATLSPERRHKLRIRCKSLRYAAEFFAELFDRDDALAYARGVAALQDVLGVLNDGHVVGQLLQQLGDDSSRQAVDLVQGWTSANVRNHLNGFEAAWREFEGLRRFWK